MAHLHEAVPEPIIHEKSTDSVLDLDKSREIREACRNADIAALVALSSSKGGLLHDDLRKQAWPILLGCALPERNSVALIQYDNWKELPPHPEEHQIKLDVDRSFTHYNDGIRDVLQLQNELFHLILSVVRNHPELCYFQGYHDIATVFLLALGRTLAAPALARLSLLRIRDYMIPSLTGALFHLQLLHPLLSPTDPDLASILPPKGTYALAATLTLFAHVIDEYDAIARLFDYLLSTTTAAPIYIYAAVLRSRRQELLQFDLEDVDMLHYALSKVPQPLLIEPLISDAQILLEQTPPSSLGRSWFSVSNSSALRTAPTAEAVASQSLDQGEAWRARLAVQMDRWDALEKRMQSTQRALWKARKPAALVGSAFAVALLAAIISRSGGERGAGSAILRNVMLGVWRALGGR